MTTAFLTKVGGRAFQEAVGICGWSRDHSLDARRDGCQVAFEGQGRIEDWELLVLYRTNLCTSEERS